MTKVEPFTSDIIGFVETKERVDQVMNQNKVKGNIVGTSQTTNTEEKKKRGRPSVNGKNIRLEHVFKQ